MRFRRLRVYVIQATCFVDLFLRFSMPKSPSSVRSWRPSALAQRGGNSTPASARASAPTSVGAELPTDAVTIGKSTITFFRKNDYQLVCGAICGKGKSAFCFKTSGSCEVASHRSAARFRPNKGHIFVKVNDSPRSKLAAQAPRGDVSLMDVHGPSIMKIGNTQKAFWGLAFSKLKKAQTVEEGEKILQAIPSRLSRGKSTTASTFSDANTSIASVVELNLATPRIPKMIGGSESIQSHIESDEELPIALREAAALSEERAEDATSQLAYFNDLLIRSCDSFDLNVSNLYQIPTFAVQSYLTVQKLVEVGKVQFNHLNQLGEQMSEYHRSQQDLSKSIRSIQKPIRSKLKGSQLWEIVESMGRQCENMQAHVDNLSDEYQATKVKLDLVEKELNETKKNADGLKQQVQKKEEELTAMNQGFQEMEKEVIKQLNAVEEKVQPRNPVPRALAENESLAKLKELFNNRIDGLESKIALGNNAVDSEIDTTGLTTTVDAVKNQVMELSAQLSTSKTTITHLQNKINQNDLSYVFGDDNISSPFCVQNLLDKTTSLTDPGVCFDYMVVTQEVQSTGDVKYDAVDNLKSKSLSAGLGLSQATTNLICLNDQKFPSLFCGKSKSGLSTFGTIKWSDWKQPGPIPGGISHDIMDNISDVKDRFQQAIDLQFTSSSRDDSLWKLLCSRMLEAAVEFVSRLVRYINDMMHNLVDCAGNDKDQAWKIVMKAVQRIFEEYFAPVRRFPLNALPKENDPNARKQLYGRLIWNSIRTYLMTKELMNKDIKHHHSVSSAYTEWAILNSGKQEAIKAKELATKTAAECKDLTATINNLKKSANEATSMAKEAKKNADKAVSQNGSRSGGGK